MKSKNVPPKLMNFKLRKFVHYSLILCILLIQVTIAGFFYNEFINDKNLTFIENQLKEVQLLEKLTDNSRNELLNAQKHLQDFFESEDDRYLKSYFNSVNKLGENLDRINHFTDRNPKLKNILILKKKDSLGTENLKLLIDSTYQFSTGSNFKIREELPKIKKYDFNYRLEKPVIQTQTYTDTIEKKGLFGRLRDAISGKVNVKKDSTVVTVKQGDALDIDKIQNDLDSIVSQVNNHYFREIKKTQLNITQNQDNNGRFYKVFSNLLVYSNGLMNIYEFAIRDSKIDLEKEYKKQNSLNNKIRMYLVLGLMILMFIVSILIMYFTRIAFIYEWKLNAANKKIKENLSFKNRILGMLSHEFRSPLKIIGIFINRISRKTKDESIKEYLKSISFTNNSLLIQANQILEYAKDQQKKNKLVPVVFHLKSEIQSILNSVEPYVETRNNRFVIHENIDPDIVVYSDNTKINQVFMNIIGNANKFTENGQITVVTKTEPVDENTISLTTEISDTGIGISKNDLEKIFEPYYQGLISDEVENLGAGLGLSLCKEIVELYSGSISATSELNKGTAVTFSINLSINH